MKKKIVDQIEHPSGDLNKPWFRVTEKLTRYIGPWTLTVDPGFECDLSSVPWIAKPFGFKTYDDDMEAAIFHDALYVYRGRSVGFLKIRRGFLKARKITRKEADNFYLEIMRQTGVSWFGRNVRYGAVSVFGKIYWDEKD